MKRLRSLLWLSVLTGTGYQLYQNRVRLIKQLTKARVALTDSQDKLDQVKADVTNVQNSLPALNQFSKDINYKLRLFQEESKPHLVAIQNILAKYQKKED
ncbi:hypothetical protein ACVRZR_02090 [Streptococcus entericus]|uniref:hypothetical protein n=1 Tax=Streptococcus entericus TaxID=155680 RepID=UPI0003742138|nr:hypothetical protein [Streptococcus entericus]